MRLTVARRRAPNECRLSDGIAEQSVEWKDARIREVKAHPDLVRLERVGERLGLRVMRARGLGAVAGREGRTTQYVLGHVTPGQRRHRREVLRTIHAIGGDLVVQYRRYVRAYALRNPVPGVDADDLEGESALAVPLALARLALPGEIQEDVDAGLIPARAGVAIAREPDPEVREELADAARAGAPAREIEDRAAGRVRVRAHTRQGPGSSSPSPAGA